MMRRSLLPLSLLLAAASAMADDPPAKLDHLGVCRTDVHKLCPNVQPGGGRIVACLKQNQDNLSDTCKQRLEQLQANKGNRSGRRPGSSAPQNNDN